MEDPSERAAAEHALTQALLQAPIANLPPQQTNLLVQAVFMAMHQGEENGVSLSRIAEIVRRQLSTAVTHGDTTTPEQHVDQIVDRLSDMLQQHTLAVMVAGYQDVVMVAMEYAGVFVHKVADDDSAYVVVAPWVDMQGRVRDVLWQMMTRRVVEAVVCNPGVLCVCVCVCWCVLMCVHFVISCCSIFRVFFPLRTHTPTPTYAHHAPTTTYTNRHHRGLAHQATLHHPPTTYCPHLSRPTMRPKLPAATNTSHASPPQPVSETAARGGPGPCYAGGAELHARGGGAHASSGGAGGTGCSC